MNMQDNKQTASAVECPQEQKAVVAEFLTDSRTGGCAFGIRGELPLPPEAQGQPAVVVTL